MRHRAYVVHRTRERLRIRIPDARNDGEFFEIVRAELDAFPEGVDVRVRPSTASVLLTHPDLPFAVLESRLRNSELFTLADGTRPSRRALAPLISASSNIDRWLKRVTSGSTDLRILLFVGIVGLAIRQLIRGEVLGPALPLLWIALQIAERVADTESPQSAPDEPMEN